VTVRHESYINHVEYRTYERGRTSVQQESYPCGIPCIHEFPRNQRKSDGCYGARDMIPVQADARSLGSNLC
jgi:hypothetical protein